MSDNGAFEVRDSLGRTLKGSRLRMVDQAKILAAMGPDNSDNNKLVAMCAAACSVRWLGEKPLHFPMSMREIFERMELIGDEGFLALDEHFQRVEAEKRAAESATYEEARDYAKN